MTIHHALYALLVIVGLLGYWWWTTGRHGANATKVFLGLSPDEEVEFFAQGFFKIGFEASDVALALVGTSRVGKAFNLTLTKEGDVVLKPFGDPPVRFRIEDLTLTRLKEDDGKLVGMSGKREVADVYRMEIAGSEPYNLRLARSFSEQLMNRKLQ